MYPIFPHEIEAAAAVLGENSRAEALHPRARQEAAIEEMRRIFDRDEIA